jgi:thioredoxin 1
MMTHPIDAVTDNDFEEKVLKSAIPVLIDFWAAWCGPCKMIAPVLEDIAHDYQDRLRIMKINVDENKEIPSRYGIRGIPTLILFKNGDIAATKVGAMNKSQLIAFLDNHL